MPMNNARRDQHQWSPYQLAVFDAVLNGEGNLVVEAVAGGAKTSTAKEAVFRFLDANPHSRIAMVAFNTTIAKKLKDEMPPEIYCKTTHGAGMGTIPGRCRVDSEGVKLNEIIDGVVGDHPVMYSLRRLVKLFKQTLMEPTFENLLLLVDRYNIDDSILEYMCFQHLSNREAGIVEEPDEEEEEEVEEDPGELFPTLEEALQEDEPKPPKPPKIPKTIPAYLRTIQEILDRCKADTRFIDYDDMIWLPHARDFRPRRGFDLIVVDELQDLNAAQLDLVKRLAGRGARLLGIGDRKQSIYAFRGADVNAIPNFITATQARTLPLSITYRCPRKHVRLVQRLVPNIEPAPDAPEGEIHLVPRNHLLGLMRQNDLVLCRTNAPLLGAAFALVRRGVKAHIKGQGDIGNELLRLLDKVRSFGTRNEGDELEEGIDRRLDLYVRLRVEKLTKREKHSAIDRLRDMAECLRLFIDESNSEADLQRRIEDLSDEKRQYGVGLSTIHRAKGLEARRVFILVPVMMPLTWPRQRDWEYTQEINIAYVGLTRSMHTLYLEAPPQGDFHDSHRIFGGFHEFDTLPQDWT